MAKPYRLRPKNSSNVAHLTNLESMFNMIGTLVQGRASKLGGAGMKRFARAAAFAALAFSFDVARGSEFPQPLPEEPVPSVAELPRTYPDNWVLVHDFHGTSPIDARAVIVDVEAQNNNVRGQIPISHFGSVLLSQARGEIYVGETFYTRQTRGERIDVITVWDAHTLMPKGEIILPGGMRGQFVTLLNSLQLINEDRWAAIFNFTPGSSVTVVDIDNRNIVSNIELPGCSLIYPTGIRGFASLCADGTMTSIALDASGQPAATVTSAVFNDIDTDPLFMTPAMVGRTGWFVSFKGNFREIDFAGDAARVLDSFAMPVQTGGTPEWRPSGWQVMSADRSGLLYVLMSPNGREGSHKDGGTEAWVIDPTSRSLVRRIPLRNHSISIEVTQQASALLVASRPDGSLDVYDAATGAFARTIASATHTPMTMSAVRP